MLLTSESPAKGCTLELGDLNPWLFCFRRKHRRARDRSRSSSSSSQSSHSYKAEEYTEETEEREESTTGFDKSRLGTKDFVGPSERGGRARGTFVRSCPLSLSLSPYSSQLFVYPNTSFIVLDTRNSVYRSQNLWFPSSLSFFFLLIFLTWKASWGFWPHYFPHLP